MQYLNESGDSLVSMSIGGQVWAWSLDTRDNDSGPNNYVIRDSDCDGQFDEVYGLDDPTFDGLTTTTTTQNALAVVAAPSLEFDDRFAGASAPLLVLVDVGDPGNVGTPGRTAEAAGCSGVVIVGATADVLNPKVVRASAGSVLRVPIAALDPSELLERVRLAGFTPIATAMRGIDYR